MSKLEKQQALPRRKLFRDITTANDALITADSVRRKPKYKAKKVKTKTKGVRNGV
jgi:hypothetical protein